MILVVDDQESMCWILSKVLQEAGFSVKTAGTAEEALSIATNNKISASIIDYRLPDKNGFDLFLELRNRNPKILGVLITSYGSKELREKALQLGFHAYFDKPFQNHALTAALQAGLKNS
ncbi:response regulator [Candidatus Aerophobetes bacterium]|uniref:Response regulator n=1 Tax=Aerophobetes bacterium TaxID=2030807 RepID=A0A523QK03_UNCAE|nr:MAG: response regulator [Candidatus Aerophobetes bacterium]